MSGEGEQCRYMLAAYPTMGGEDTCYDHRHDEPTFALARAMAEVMQNVDEPSDEQVAWFLDDAAVVVDDFTPAPASWLVTEPQPSREPGIDLTFAINDVEYLIQENDSGGHVQSHPVRRTEYRSWLCTCGLAEQERGGHSPQHEDWCDLWADSE